MTQKTFQDFTDDSEELWSFDHYGPTADEPLPYGVATFPADYYQLIERGFSWGTLAEESPSPDADIHPADADRQDARDRHRKHMSELEARGELERPSPDASADKSEGADGTPRAAPDGGAVVDDPTPPTADPDDPPANETVRIIYGITRVMHTPRTVEGTTSSTGKTISVDLDENNSYRLDASEIFSGNSEFRDSRYFELYTPARLKQNQRANKAPGPRAGTDSVSDADDLPAPTHWPAVDEPADAPDECPECGQTAAPWTDKRAPVCEACGYMHEQDDDEEAPDDDDGGDDIEQQGFQDLERGDTLIIDGYRGEFVITRVHEMVGTSTTNYLEAARRDGGEWSEVVIQDGSPYDDRKLKVNDDAEVSVGINVNDSEMAQEYDVTGQDMDRVRRYIRARRDE